MNRNFGQKYIISDDFMYKIPFFMLQASKEVVQIYLHSDRITYMLIPNFTLKYGVSKWIRKK